MGDGILLFGTRGYRYVPIAFLTRPILILGTNTADGYCPGKFNIWALPETTQATQTGVCDQLLQGLAEYNPAESVSLTSGRYFPNRDFPNHSTCPFSGPALARLLRQSTDIPQINLRHYELDEEHCRALVTEEGVRKELEINLNGCHLTEAGETVLFDGIRRNRGPTSLYGCRFNAQRLADALNGNTRIHKFQCRDGEGTTDDNLLFLFRALAGNLGIKVLILSHRSIKDESWDVMCQSLANHPAITHLVLEFTASHDESSRPLSPGSTYMVMSEARKTHRTQSLVEMLKVNTTICKINLDEDQHDNSIWRNEGEPRLEMNKFRPRIVAVKKAQGTLRAPLFGRSLHAVNDNNTFIFMIVKGNVDLFAEMFHGRHCRARKRSRYGK